MIHTIPAILFGLLIFLVSAESSPPGAGLAPDYVAHFMEYGIFAATLVWAVTSGLRKQFTPRRAVLAFFISSAYAATDELHQRFVPGRDPSLQDLFADAVGSAIFVLALFLAIRYWKRRKATPATE